MRAALVVGINDYPVAPLKGAVKDTNEMGDILGTHEDGRDNFSVIKLTTPPEAVTRPVLKEAIRILFNSNSDLCLFYFSGHGIITNAGGYIVTSDFQKFDEGIAMDEILALAHQSQVKEKVILLDCCHAGA